MKIEFRFHALQRMFERKISAAEVLETVATGKIIEEYPNDQPYPSCLRLAFIKGRPLHVVTAEATKEKITIIITAYVPSTEQWESGFEKRKQK